MDSVSDQRERPTRRLWIGIPGMQPDEETIRLLEDLRPGGIVLFRRNIESLDQVRVLVKRLKEVVGGDLVVSVDQEGGLVARFFRELTAFPGNMALGAAAFREPSLGEHLAFEQGVHTGAALRELGITLNLAPVLDLASTGENPGIHIRSFGESPELAERLGGAMIRGLRQGGVHACLKHFPGLGNAGLDTHLDLPVIPARDAEAHLRPFRAGVEAGAPLVMTSHAVYEAFDRDVPATFSRRLLEDVLRHDLGFAGAVATDDLEMGAMRNRFGFDETVRQASAAGHDVLCICGDPGLQHRAAALLREGSSERASWFGDPRAIHARLDRLHPPEPPARSDPAAALSLAEAIAGRAVTIVRDDRRALPLGRRERALLVLPTLRGETAVEDPLRGEDDARSLIEGFGAAADLHALPTEPSAADVDALLLRAAAYPKLLIVLTNARFLPAQAHLARTAAASHPGTILLAIRNPFDLEVMGPGTLHAAVASYGFRPVQLRALAAVVKGELPSYGRLPVTLRPVSA